MIFHVFFSKKIKFWRFFTFSKNHIFLILWIYNLTFYLFGFLQKLYTYLISKNQKIWFLEKSKIVKIWIFFQKMNEFHQFLSFSHFFSFFHSFNFYKILYLISKNQKIWFLEKLKNVKFLIFLRKIKSIQCENKQNLMIFPLCIKKN